MWVHFWCSRAGGKLVITNKPDGWVDCLDQVKNEPIISRKSSQTSENEMILVCDIKGARHPRGDRGYTKINGNLDLKQPIKDKSSELALWSRWRRSMTGRQVLRLSWLICTSFSHCGCDKSRKRAAHNSNSDEMKTTEAAGRNPEPLARAVTALPRGASEDLLFLSYVTRVCWMLDLWGCLPLQKRLSGEKRRRPVLDPAA